MSVLWWQLQWLVLVDRELVTFVTMFALCYEDLLHSVNKCLQAEMNASYLSSLFFFLTLCNKCLCQYLCCLGTGMLQIQIWMAAVVCQAWALPSFEVVFIIKPGLLAVCDMIRWWQSVCCVCLALSSLSVHHSPLLACLSVHLGSWAAVAYLAVVAPKEMSSQGALRQRSRRSAAWCRTRSIRLPASC